MQDFTNDSSTQQSTVSLAFLRLSQKLQKFFDDITPFRTARWIGALVFILLFMIRIVMLQGWYIITYALGIYHLNLFIAFLTPKIDPAMDEFEDDSGPSLPTRANEEFRPFIRRLPEFKFWYSVIKSTLLSIVLTFFQFVDVPVFWPFLVFYFIVLFGIIMKRQIRIRFRVQTNEEKKLACTKTFNTKINFTNKKTANESITLEYARFTVYVTAYRVPRVDSPTS